MRTPVRSLVEAQDFHLFEQWKTGARSKVVESVFVLQRVFEEGLSRLGGIQV